MIIFTTIAPNNLEAQTEAINSWRKYYEVYSVNSQEEINQLTELYPQVKFIPTEELYYTAGNKTLVKVSGILKAIQNINSKYNAIVNSDIILSSKVDPKSLCNKKTLEKAMIIGTRYELNELPPEPFKAGYDVFIFDIKMVKHLMNDKYVIGLPWWDYWMPIAILKSLYDVYHIKNKAIFHRTHTTNWDQGYYDSFGLTLYHDLVKKGMMNEVHPSTKISELAMGMKGYVEQFQKNIKIRYW